IYVASSVSELEQMETYYILLYNASFSQDYYNIKAGSNLIGSPYAGKSEGEMLIIKEKLSLSSKKKWENDIITADMIGWGNQTEDRKNVIKDKIGYSNKKVWDSLSPDDRTKRVEISKNNIKNASFKGKSHSEETKK